MGSRRFRCYASGIGILLPPLTKKQQKRRAKSKRASKARNFQRRVVKAKQHINPNFKLNP